VEVDFGLDGALGVVVGSPGWVGVGEDGEAFDGVVVAVLDAVVVAVHSLGECGFFVALDFDVDENPGFLAVVEVYLGEFVGVAMDGMKKVEGDALGFRSTKLREVRGRSIWIVVLKFKHAFSCCWCDYL
jgi:hypothetical protein